MSPVSSWSGWLGRYTYYISKLYMNDVSLLRKNDHSEYDLRILLYIKIMEFDRVTSIYGRLDAKQFSVLFPWIENENALPPLEESIQKYKKLIKGEI